DTDSEVVAHLISSHLKSGLTPVEAAKAAFDMLEGAFALGVVFQGEEDLIVGARRGSPLAVGYGDGAMYLGSDAFALAPMTNRVTFLDDGDWAEIRRDSVTIRNAAGDVVERPIKITDASSQLVDKGNHRHFMA
ncbi:MAG TPA: glutamine--fructose-6-phosphate aminotransferase, partial [Rhodobiaceae bacterium]|nr:glutamine--fructose-6-phosphate aminotransferase [Rhodobiaceae bacterium]